MSVVSIFGSEAPANTALEEGVTPTLGTWFRSSEAGSVLGIRTYEDTADVGALRTVALYDANGVLLASKSAAVGSSTGWATILFTSPVEISSNSHYLAAVFCGEASGKVTLHYTAHKFASPVTSGPLTALSQAEGAGIAGNGGNGVFVYGSALEKPHNAFNESWYGVDISFELPETEPEPEPEPEPEHVVTWPYVSFEGPEPLPIEVVPPQAMHMEVVEPQPMHLEVEE